MKIDRREFLGGLGALTALDVMALPLEAKPYLRVGLFSDTHIKTTPESFSLTAAAFKTFKAQGVDAIVHCGDLADFHYDEAYAMYRTGLAETFGDKPPALVYSYADHDVLDPNWDRTKRVAPAHFNAKWAFDDMRAKIGIDHGLFCEKKIGGLTFLAVPEQVRLIGGFPFVRERIAAACAASPNKPVILVTHLPPFATTRQSCSAGFVELKQILDDFPQVICFHGHTHIPFVNETNIWQGNFTAVNCGSLYEWHGRGIASPFVANRSYWVGVAEFYQDRMIIRRFDVRTEQEVRTDATWCVPLPFAAKSAPYALANARCRERKVAYPKGSALKIEHLPAPQNLLRVWVPNSSAEEKISVHRFRAYERIGEKWKEIALQDRLGEFHLMPDAVRGGVWIEVSDGYFKSGATYGITATPVGFRGTEGVPLAAKWTAPELAKTECIWSCDDPMAKLTAVIDKKSVPVADGWWDVPDGKTIDISLPREIWDQSKKTHLRFDFTVDVAQSCADHEGMMMNLTPANGNWRKAAIHRLALPAGAVDGFRYVKTFVSQGVAFAHKIMFVAKFGGKVRLRSVRLEKYV